jgi:hypothetical protein
MIPAKEKARDLVLSFYYALPNNGSTEGINSTTRRYQEGIRCALISVGTILDEYQSISDLESTLVVGGQVMSIVDKIVYWNEVKSQIQKL